LHFFFSLVSLSRFSSVLERERDQNPSFSPALAKKLIFFKKTENVFRLHGERQQEKKKEKSRRTLSSLSLSLPSSLRISIKKKEGRQQQQQRRIYSLLNETTSMDWMVSLSPSLTSSSVFLFCFGFFFFKRKSKVSFFSSFRGRRRRRTTASETFFYFFPSFVPSMIASIDSTLASSMTAVICIFLMP